MGEGIIKNGLMLGGVLFDYVLSPLNLRVLRGAGGGAPVLYCRLVLGKVDVTI